MRRLSLTIAALALVAAGGWTAGRRMQSPDQAAARTKAPIASWMTAPVERRVLSRTIITRGTVRSDAQVFVEVPASVSGPAIVTKLGSRRGETVSEGQVVVEISGRPIFILIGEIPAYRQMSSGVHGSDIEQLQASLERLGCNATIERGVFGPRTAQCVTRLYRDAGYTAHPTLGASSEVTIAFGEVVFVPSGDVRVLDAPLNLGPTTSASPTNANFQASSFSGLVTLAIGNLQVDVSFAPSDRSILHPEMPVELFDDATAVTYPAVLSAVADTPASGTASSVSLAGVITPVPEVQLPFELVGTSLRATITAASTEAEMLVVPLSAISSAADGSSFVSVVPQGALVTLDPTLVAVEAGLSADGFVSIAPITPGQLDIGDRVVVGR